MPTQQQGIRPKKVQAAKISQETWESFKGDISRLYLCERKTLDEVRIAMEEETGFVATKAQYIRMVNEVWHLKKNLTREDAKIIDSREKKRSLDGKKTGVKIGDRKLDESELRRKRSRHHVSVFEQHQRRIEELNRQSIGPMTPEDMKIFTPIPSVASPLSPALSRSQTPPHLGSEASSPHCLPPLSGAPAAHEAPSPLLGAMVRFAVASPYSSNRVLSPLSPYFDSNISVVLASNAIPSPASSRPQLITPSPAASWELLDFALLPRAPSPSTSRLQNVISRGITGFLLPTVLHNPLLKMTPSISFAVIFEEHVKDFFEGTHESLVAASKDDSTIQQILSPMPVTCSIDQWVSKIDPKQLGRPPTIVQILCFLKAYIIRTSNRTDDAPIRRKTMDRLLKSGFLKTHVLVVEMILKQARIRNSQNHDASSKGSSGDAYAAGFELVVDSFAVDLLYSAARTGDIALIKLLLRIGPFQNIGRGIQSAAVTQRVGITAIQYAIEYGKTTACDFLLRQGFDVNVPPISHLSPSLLWTAVMVDSPLLVFDLLHRHGAQDRRKTFDFQNPRREKYKKELILGGNVWLYTIKTSDATLEALEVGTALQLSVAGRRFDCLRALLPAASDRAQPGLEPLRSNELSALLMVATHNSDSIMIEELACQELWEGQIAHQNQGDDALVMAVVAQDIPCIKSLLKHGADFKNIDILHFSKIALPGTPPDWFRRFMGTLRREGLITVDLFQRAQESYQKHRDQSASAGEFVSISSIIRTPIPPSFENREPHYRMDLPIFEILKRLEILAPGYSPIRRALLRNFIALTSTFLQSMEMNVEIYASHTNPTIIFKLVGTALNNVQSEAAAYFNTLGRLFCDMWDICACIDFQIRTISISWESLPPLETGHLYKIQERLMQVHSDGGPRTIWNEVNIRNERAVAFFRRQHFDFARSSQSPCEHLLRALTDIPPKHMGDLKHVIDWVLSSSNMRFQRSFCAAITDLVPALNNTQLLSLLRLAIHCDAYETALLVTSVSPDIKVAQKSFHEAIWFAGPETFDLVLGQYWRTARDDSEISFELLLFIAISAGHLYKVVKLLPFAKIDCDYGLERTPLGVAVFLGRLDICKALLESGASKHLLQYENEASNKGYFAIACLIRTKRIKDQKRRMTLNRP
ncbi:hypothetical protein TWF281_011144 [Arthrobotrys megalospora]